MSIRRRGEVQPDSSSGKAYLEQKAGMARAIEQHVGNVRDALGELGQQVVVREAKSGHRVFVLVERGKEETFRQTVKSVGVPETLSRRTSGPWPAAEFLSERVKTPQICRCEMTELRKITPEEIAAAVSEMNRELKAVGEGAIDRIDCSPENIEQGLARLVLSLVELLRRLLERQAIRRMEGGSLGEAKVEEMGQALMRLEAKVNELAAAFGLKPEDLNLELGPLGNLLE